MTNLDIYDAAVTEIQTRTLYPVGFFKLDDGVVLPSYGTTDSACFDIRYFNTVNNVIKLNPGQTYAFPTGLIVDLAKGTHMRLYSRSGNALNKGFALANGVGIVDEDYVEEIKIILYNFSENTVFITPGDKIAQGEVVETSPHRDIREIVKKPGQKTNRVGGFGSTDIHKEPVMTNLSDAIRKYGGGKPQNANS